MAAEFTAKQFHVLTYLDIQYFGILLCCPQVGVSQHFRHAFHGYTIKQRNGRGKRVTAGIKGK
jgi:hypothetical protein